MADYIERDKVLEAILNLPPKMDEQGYGWLGRMGVWQMIRDFQSADVQPIGWIPVAEQLPQIEKDVLVCAYGTLIRTWCLHKKYSKRFWETEEGYFDDFNAVSHWMPLPELPKDGEE